MEYKVNNSAISIENYNRSMSKLYTYSIITYIKIWTLAFYCKVALVIVIKSFPSFTIQEVCW